MTEGDRRDDVLDRLAADDVVAAARTWFGAPVELLDWQVRDIYAPRVSATLGAYAVEGSARVGGGAEPFRFVLKVLVGGSSQAEAEMAAYRAFDARPPHGLDVPRFLGATPLGAGATGLWLEAVEDEAGPDWPLDAFARAGFHYGRYAGADLTGAAPGHSPASSVKDFRAQQDERAEGLRRLAAEADHPILSRAYPPDVVSGFGRLWAARERLFDALARVPVAACHGDAQRRNLLARRSADGRWRTVAIDWANAGRAPLGSDAAVLVHQALVYFQTDAAPRELDRAVFEGYVAGLRDAGVDVPIGQVRLGYVLQAALWNGLMEASTVGRLAFDAGWPARAELFNRRPFGAILERRAELGRLLVALVDEAGLA